MTRLAAVLLTFLSLAILACSSEPTPTPSPTRTPTPTHPPTPTWVFTDNYSAVVEEWVSGFNARTYLNLAYDDDWQAALPYLRATSDEHNDVYLSMIADHMWSVVLPYLQPLADDNGFGKVWRDMTKKRTYDAAEDAQGYIYISRFIPSWYADEAERLTDSVGDAVRSNQVTGDYSAANRWADALVQAWLLAAEAGSTSAEERQEFFAAWDHFNAAGLLMRMASYEQN